ncbi:DUF6362 family protein [Bradyrhizobium sp. Ai1a-2]|uniref:DUF6362 family protein n=1 Tax=Bradyrhizobium sp. Ai1a-2 TaxID=196490 RepID=UPI000481CDC7|nr:DUF6362 family protein [Bradyrhizobium sp. Ai1a-2]
MSNWTRELVRARFVEAADTEWRMPGGMRLGGKSGFWPGYLHTFEEMSGWGTKRLAEERELRLSRIPPSSAAISRFEQVLEWSATRIESDQFRQLLWAFVRCRVSGRSFSEKCRKEGWNRVTAYERINRLLDAIAIDLNNDNAPLQLPEDNWPLQEGAVSGSNSCMLAVGSEDDGEPAKSPSAIIFPNGAAADLLKSKDDLTRFAKHLKAVNRRRRKMRERRRRALLAKGRA